MQGVRYASAEAVNPRGTIRTIGITSEDKDTWVNPSLRATSPTSFSCSWTVAHIVIYQTSAKDPFHFDAKPDSWSALGKNESGYRSRSWTYFHDLLIFIIYEEKNSNIFVLNSLKLVKHLEIWKSLFKYVFWRATFLVLVNISKYLLQKYFSP